MSSEPRHEDRGSVLPLVIGMVACLLLLGAGVTAATSAFIAQNRLQHSCDGAAAAAADAATRAQQWGGSGTPGAAGRVEAVAYLRARGADVAIQASQSGDAMTLTCRTDASITFGGLFGARTLDITAHAVGRSVLGP